MKGFVSLAVGYGRLGEQTEDGVRVLPFLAPIWIIGPPEDCKLFQLPNLWWMGLN